MLGLQTDFRPPCDYSDAGWRFYTSSNERKKKRKEKEESVEKKQEKIRTYIYVYRRGIYVQAVRNYIACQEYKRRSLTGNEFTRG